MNRVTDYFKQMAQAEDWQRSANEAKQLRELAAKHNVIITMPIHDEMIVEGDTENVSAFMKEWMNREPRASP